MLRLLAIGDSIIAGVGVSDAAEALPSRVAIALAKQGHCRVSWCALGYNGAVTSQLLERLRERAFSKIQPDAVLVSNGVNEVTSLGHEKAFVQAKKTFYAELARRFPSARLFQLGLPPMDQFPALPQPLRHLLGRRAASFDANLRCWLAESRAATYLPFDGDIDPTQFARDGYHPAEAAVALWAESLAVPMLQVLGRETGSQAHDAVSAPAS